MTSPVKSEDKVRTPAMRFGEPHDVVADSSLSRSQKIKALDTWELDARRLSEASSEGMAGGERTRLHEALKAKDTPILPLKPASTSQ